ncbi:MAG: preprotein translocase subunit SecG [Acutalibacteraceae bacterium]
MAWYEILIGILLFIFAIVIIAVILLQEGRRSGLSGTISGASETFFSKSGARTVDRILSKWTKFIVIGFLILTLVTTIISVYVS